MFIGKRRLASVLIISVLIILKFQIFWKYLQDKEMIKTSKPSFSYIMYCRLLRVLDELHFCLKWYQSKWTWRTQPLSWPALFNLKSSREELQGNVSKLDIDDFLIRATLIVKKSHIREEDGAYLRISFWHLLMTLKSK